MGVQVVRGRRMNVRVLVGLLVVWCGAPVGRRVADGQETSDPVQTHNISAPEDIRQPHGERVEVQITIVTNEAGPRRIATVTGATLHAVRFATCARRALPLLCCHCAAAEPVEF